MKCATIQPGYTNGGMTYLLAETEWMGWMWLIPYSLTRMDLNTAMMWDSWHNRVLMAKPRFLILWERMLTPEKVKLIEDGTHFQTNSIVVIQFWFVHGYPGYCLLFVWLAIYMMNKKEQELSHEAPVFQKCRWRCGAFNYSDWEQSGRTETIEMVWVKCGWGNGFGVGKAELSDIYKAVFKLTGVLLLIIF